MEREINRLIELSKTATLKELIDVIEVLTTKHTYNTTLLGNFDDKPLYRARKHNNLYGNADTKGKVKDFMYESELWNVPAQYAPLGRCNDKNESMLYCTNTLNTAILECKPEAGDYITTAILVPYRRNKILSVVREPLLLQLVGQKYLSQIDGIRDIIKHVPPDKDERHLIFDNFLDHLFHMEVGPNDEHLYKLSLAITRVKMLPFKIKEKNYIPDGIIYSSIVRNKRDYNVLLRPDTAKQLYYIERFKTVKILVSNDEHVLLKNIRDGWPVRLETKPYKTPSVIFWSGQFKNQPIYRLRKHQ